MVQTISLLQCVSGRQLFCLLSTPERVYLRCPSLTRESVPSCVYVSKCPFMMSNKTHTQKKNKNRKMLNSLRRGKKGKQLIHFPCAFFFLLAVPFSYFKRLSSVSLWLKIMKNFCPEGFSLKTLKLQSVVPAV